MDALLRIEELEKYYGTKTMVTKALDQISFTVNEGEFLGIMGASGSGKTTLLNCISTIDTATAGHIYLRDRDITELKEDALAEFRQKNLGFVFQDFNLLDTFSLQDNIFLPLVLAGKKYDEMKKRIDPIAHRLGIWELLQKFPYEVSGGQKQRAAIARAIITYPELILADEPTGALDSRSAGQILDIFADVNHSGQTILMVTHSVQAACRAGRVLFIKDGQVYHQIYRGAMTDDELYQAISRTLTELATSRERSVAVHG